MSTSGAVCQRGRNEPGGATAAPIRLFVLVDALGWSILRECAFLDGVLPYRRPLRTVLGFSSGAIPTILTGQPPSVTGHWNLFFRDPAGSPFRWLRPFLFLPDWILDSRVTSRLLREAGRRLLGLGPLFECGVSPRLLPFLSWCEKRNIYEPGGIACGGSIFDELHAAEAPYAAYSFHRFSDRQILDRVLADLQSAAPAPFQFLYLSELDSFLHAHCGDTPAIQRALDFYAQRLEEIFDSARRVTPGASLTVFSDHGMTPVARRYDLLADLRRLGLSCPGDYLAVHDSTMSRYWFDSDRARRAICGLLEGLPCGRMLTKQEEVDLGIWFADRRYGEVIFLFDPGWILARSDFNGSSWNPAGMHGFHPDDPDSDGVFLSSREPTVAVTSIADVYPCLLEGAGLHGRKDQCEVRA